MNFKNFQKKIALGFFILGFSIAIAAIFFGIQYPPKNYDNLWIISRMTFSFFTMWILGFAIECHRLNDLRLNNIFES